jgi:multimeric flavodoxin WrbA
LKKAIILLATLKKDAPSNTEALSDFLIEKLQKNGVSCETVKLVNQNILPGTYEDMGAGDAWPGILAKLLEADIIIFATPVWWGSHSSEMQKVIERLDSIHDEILSGKESRLADKVGGIVITGDSDGAEQIIGIISNFINAIGILLPPFATLSVLWEGHRKDAKKTREQLMEEYEKEYASTSDKMVTQLLKYSK